MQPFHHPAIELNRAARCVFRQRERRDDLARLLDLGRGRREGGVTRFDLARMNQRLAVKAEIAGLRAFAGKAFDIGDVAERAIQDGQPVSARGQHAMADHRQHGGAAGQHPDPGFAGNVVRAEYEAGEPHFLVLGLRGQMLGIEHAARGLDHDPDLDRHVGANIGEPVGDRGEIIDARHFGHQNAVGLGLAGHREIVEPPRRIERIDAHQHFAAAKTAFRQRAGDLRPRGFLGVGRDGIFEVEDDAVGRQKPRFFQRARIRSRHEQQTATRSDHHPPLYFGMTAITLCHDNRKPCAARPPMVIGGEPGRGQR